MRAVLDRCTGSRDRAERLLGPRGRVLAAYEPTLLDLPGQDAYPDLPPLAALAARDRLLAALQETIAALAADAPLLLVLDDLQWADELSLDVLERMPAELFGRLPIVLVGAFRSEEATPRLLRLARARGVDGIALGRLDGAAVARMVESMLALDRLPAPLYDRLSATSSGNPFFVAEYLRAAVEQGWIVRDVGASWRLSGEGGLPALPGSLQELCDLRLAALSGPARCLAETAAVFGREVEGDLLAAIAGLPETEGMDALEELSARSLFEELSEDRFRFLHDKLREVTYDGLPPERQRELHRRAAIALERRSDGRKPSLRPVLAHHWAHAGSYAKAIAHLEAAGEEALARAAHAEAASLFHRALELDLLLEPEERASVARRARWHRRLGEAYHAVGDLTRSEEHSTRALEGFGQPLPLSRAGWAAKLVVELGRQAYHLARPYREELPPARRAHFEEAALAAARVAHKEYFAEEGLPLVASLLFAANLAERAGTEGPLALHYAQLGYLAGVCRLRALAATYFVRAGRSAGAANDPHGLLDALTHEALFQAGDGRLSEAMALGARALDVAAGAPDPLHREGVLLILAHVDLCAGRYEASMAHGEALLASARARANARNEAFGRYAIARALVRRGEHGAALDHLAEAREVLESLPGDALAESICAGITALALARNGDLVGAEHMADDAMAAIRRAPPAALSLADGHDGAAEVYLDLWQRASLTGAPVPPSIVDGAARAGAIMRTSAILFPLCRPRWLLHVGQVRALRGGARSAAWAFARAGALASALGMPYEAEAAERRLAELRG
jgi:hypothetical protein